MDGFFDLNIPYAASSKTTRIKLAVKAMELGYSGIAYNHSFKGIMSDQDYCSIPLLSLSSLLDMAPSLAFSVNLHRDLLGVPHSSPFRQYTRLTVSVDTPSQAQVLNSGNPVLKTYDLVAVKPLSQIAFDHACHTSEVDIISIDFSEKLPFRLKLSMVKVALERGVCFEIMYSDLIVDVQTRRQMIPNAKLLVDWTRGKNLIFTSAASSVNEFRGPNDVANLSSLLGLSMERAKAAVSKNCRNLITNALRRKHFYKEAIRVELISSNEISDAKEHLSVEWLKWDPISSGEGDLKLDDMAKSFAATSRPSKTAKAFDFSLQSNGMTSNVLLSNESVMFQKSVMDIDAKATCVSDVNIDMLCENSTPLAPQNRNLGLKDSDVVLHAENVASLEGVTRMVVKDQDDILVTEKVSSIEQPGNCGDDSAITIDYIPPWVDTDGTEVENVFPLLNRVNTEFMMEPIAKTVSGGKPLEESGDETAALIDCIPFAAISDGTKVKDAPSIVCKENLEKLAVEEQEHEDADTVSIPLVNEYLKVQNNILNFSTETCISLEEVGMKGQMPEAETNSERNHPTWDRFLSEIAALDMKDNEGAVIAYGIYVGTEIFKKILAHEIKTASLYSEHGEICFSYSNGFLLESNFIILA